MSNKKEVLFLREEYGEGRGKYIYPHGGKYEGDWRNGKYQGQGTLTYPNGDKYVGEFKDGKQNDKGTYTCSDGRKYEGEWKEGKKHGQGTFTWSHGDNYVGEYKDGKKWNGTVYDNDGIKKSKYVNGVNPYETPTHSHLNPSSFFSCYWSRNWCSLSI